MTTDRVRHVTTQMTGWLFRTLGVLVLLGLMGQTAHAQQRPLVTEDPETVGSGVVLLEAGFDFLIEEEFPTSGLVGDVLRFPTYGLSIGVSSIAEIQIDGGLRSRLSISDRSVAPLSDMLTVTGESTSSIDDIVIGTKVRLRAEGASAPALGFRFATKLPIAGNEGGLGLDTTDFFASLLVGKTIRSVRLVANIGFGILGDPSRGDRQNDVVTYGVSFARAIRQGLEVVGELNGRVHTRAGDDPPSGTESRSLMRLGGRYTRGAGRVDGAVVIGVTSVGPGIGITAGYTHVFSGFNVP